MESQTGIEVTVIEWKNGEREIAIHLKDLEKLVTISAASARDLSFLLMECADFINPPFGASTVSPVIESDTDSSESISFFGPYEEDDESEDYDEYEDENEDEEM